MAKTLHVADLFAGAGGTSTGVVRAAEAAGRRLDLTAVNHWPTAIETHAANHPAARHLCASLEQVDPRKVIGRRRLDLLVASPECTHHSRARGGKPTTDQQRASGWHVVRWAEALRPRAILVENVVEWQDWGPVGTNGRPVKKLRGHTFAAWVSALESLGYRVSWRVLRSADYGDPTTRQRLFVMARLGRGPVPWPDPTHTEGGEQTLFGDLKRWRPAREIIDWSLPGESIFTRKRPLSDNTLRRIEAGLKRFGGAAAGPFLVVLRQHMAGRSLGDPLPTVCAGGEHLGLCQPFAMHTTHHGGERVSDLGEPLQTVTTRDRHGLVEPVAGPVQIDIRFRMLQPHELAGAMGFPKGYVFKGNRADQVRQIGGAVSVGLAEALATAQIEGKP